MPLEPWLRDKRPWLTIVGVVPDMLQVGFDADPGGLDIYYPLAQAPPIDPRLYLVLRGEIDRGALLPALDPPTLATAAVLLAAVALLACVLPALRATRVDPLAALSAY